MIINTIKYKKLKEATAPAKQKSWEEYGQFMENKRSIENTKQFYKVLKNMRKECPIKFIKDKYGKILTKCIEIMARWKEYFMEFLEETEVCNSTQE
jgi:ATP-dependent exoDNAse (exonuclease V) beta subunit